MRVVRRYVAFPVMQFAAWRLLPPKQVRRRAMGNGFPYVIRSYKMYEIHQLFRNCFKVNYEAPVIGKKISDSDFW